jgi:hypothetical protein
MEALEQGRLVEIPEDATIRGRILRGQVEAGFETLGKTDRDIVFIMGPDGLSLLPGLPTLEALDQIGYSPGYVQGLVADSYTFRLVVFEGGDTAPPATWDNTLDMVAACRPELAWDIARHRNALKNTPFEVFAADVADPLDDIDLAGSAHPDYMSLSRYLALSEAERSDPAKLRRALFHAEHIGTQFYGDGYTRTRDGQIGLAEYLIPNGPVASLPGAIVVDLF